MDCLTGLATSISSDLVKAGVHELRYPCCFNNLVEDLQNQKVNLIATRDSVNDRVEHAKKQAMKTDEVVDAWLKEANPLIDNVEELLKKTRTNKSCCFGHCSDWIWRYRLGKKLAKKKGDVETCIQKGSKYIQLERIASLPSLSILSSEDILKFDSRRSAYVKLMEALKDDEVSMIGLYGMGGCGKTTLALDLQKTAEAEHLFDKVLFVPVSSTVEVPRIQDKFASPLQLKFPEKEETERARRLCKRLIDEKRILVILDDVWGKLDFGAIGIPSRENHKGCKVLITTRSEDVCTLMDCQKKIQLSILTDGEAWTLFQKQAHVSEGSPNIIKDLAREISNECKGLPVAIVAVASTLKDKAEVNWKVALDRLRSSKPVNIEKGLQNPYKCLQLSYDNLDIEEAKSLFLLCSVFPEDYEIPMEDVTRFAIGLGLVGEVRSYEGARNEVSAAKNKLISSCLLLDAGLDFDKRECVKMHDLVRDVAHWIAKNENKAIKCALEKEVIVEDSSPRYLWCEEFPNELDCSNLELLVIMTDLDVSDEIFEGMGRLRVLFLSLTGERRLLSMMSFKSCTNLRGLFLGGWELGDISFIGDMKKLESLTLIDCSFLELPSDVVVTQQTNLRLVHLSDCEMERNLFEVIGRHPQLEELHIEDFRPKWYFYNENYVEFFKKFSVSALQRYQIHLGTKLRQKGDFNCQRALFLSCFDTSNAAVMYLAKKAEALGITTIQGGGAKNIIPDIFQIEGGGMNELIHLCIEDSKDIECLVDTSNHLSQVGTFFSMLLTITIIRMEYLGALFRGRLPTSGLFEKLEMLYIQQCPKLTSLFTLAVARSLLQLRNLEIWYCDGLKHIVAYDDDTEEISADDRRLLFPKLKQLQVYMCNKLKYIIPVTFAQGLQQLKYLKIKAVGPEMKYVFGQCTHGDQSQNELKIDLPSLEYLELDQMPNMISVFPENCHAMCPSLCRFYLWRCPKFDINNFMAGWKVGKQSDLSSTKDIRTIEKLFLTLETLNIDNNKVESIFRFNGQPMSLGLQSLWLRNLPQMTYICVGSKNSFTFQNLQTLEIIGCAKLEVIFPASVVRCLPELKSLRIKECKELKQIIEEDMENQKLANPCFPKLAVLIVHQCHKLERLISVSASNDLPNIEVLIINGASELEELIGCEQGQGDEIGGKVKVELPKLKLLIFNHLTSLCQGIELQTVRHRVVHNCPKLSLTSTTTLQELEKNPLEDFERTGLPPWELANMVEEVARDFIVENEATRDFPVGPEAQTASAGELPSSQINEELEKEFVGKVFGSEIPAIATSPTDSELIQRPSPSPLDIPLHKTHSHELVDGQSMSAPCLMNQQKPLEETQSTIEIPQSTEDIVKESIQEGSTSEEAIKTTLSPDLDKGVSLDVVLATHTESSGGDMLVQDSHVVEQGDKPNEGDTRALLCQKIQNGDDSIQNGYKEGQIGVVSNDSSIEVPPDTR